jgi:hypothetical protein
VTEVPKKQREYWSERQGRGPRTRGLNFLTIKKLAFEALDALREDDYFQEAFGLTCAEKGEIPGTLGNDIERWFLLTLYREHIDPFHWMRTYWDEDTFFDVLEVMHDHCSKPVSGYFHSYADCGMHYTGFDKDAGREEYRRRLNGVLRHFERPLEVDEHGRVIQPPPDELRPLLAVKMPESVDPDLRARLDAAVELFQSRNASKVDRRRAVRDLADVLEPLRQDIKEELLSKDERELFRLANGFGIRHNSRAQLTDYDDEIRLRWAFYVYLATAQAVLLVQDRQKGSPEANATAVHLQALPDRQGGS